MSQKPTQKVKWPNVTLTSFPQFETSLDTWFKRKNIPVWITEYGQESKPGEPKGVTESQQAAYVTQAIALAKKDPRVPMFIWFVMRDSPGSTWQSGVYRTNGSAKPARAKFAAAAKPLSAVNSSITVKGGTKNPALTVYVRSFCANSPAGSLVGLNSRTTLGGKLVAVSQAQVSLSPQCTIAYRPTGLTIAKGKTYVIALDLNTAVGGSANRTITIRGVGQLPPTDPPAADVGSPSGDATSRAKL